jgi:Holin of 3TMs, for gene-transfer release
MTAEVCAPKSESAKKNEDWMNTKWRPAMGWMYMLVCIMDFVVFPILWSMVQVVGDGKVESQWVPITLQGAGLFHIAMGAILGIAAYGRTQEKMAGANNGGLQFPSATSAPSSFSAPTPRAYTPAPSFGNTTLGNNTMSSSGSFGRAPIQPDHPEI